jgi:hypothetical protein
MSMIKLSSAASPTTQKEKGAERRIFPASALSVSSRNGLEIQLPDRSHPFFDLPLASVASPITFSMMPTIRCARRTSETTGFEE